MKDNDDGSVSAATLGAFLGISARAVADLGKRGIAVRAGPGRWRLRESVARYCDDLRRPAKGNGGEAASASAVGFAAAQADLVALRVARQRDELLDARDVEAEVERCSARGALRDARSPEPDRGRHGGIRTATLSPVRLQSMSALSHPAVALP
jgi:phage terminase Nu1 subunit (DNA packaging protein)